MTHPSKHKAAALLALLCLAAPGLQAGKVRKSLDNLKHAEGWDTLNLKVMEKDAAGRPTLERDADGAANRVERRTSYHPDGRKESQIITVVAKASDKTMYMEKRDWTENGYLESVYMKDDTFNKKGQPLNGRIDEKQYKGGRLTLDVKKKYSDVSGDWTVLYKQTVRYYPDGDLRERITENPHNHEKERESWSETKRPEGRKAFSQRWDTKRNLWY